MSDSRPIEVDVAIVGGGPAGLAAAMALRAGGVARVTVLEREEAAGGIPRHCGHPPFGLREFRRLMTGPAYARHLVAAALAAGVDIRPRHSVVRLHPGGQLDLASPDGTRQMAARRVILATGVRETPRSARLIDGDRPLGVINTGALQAYTYLEQLRPFARPVIVGTELVAFSALLTCRKAGIRPVAMIEAGTRATARWPTSLAPRLLGVPLHLRTQLVEIRGRKNVEGVVAAGPDGTPREIACDGVILTGQFQPAAELVRASHLRLDAGSGGPAIDQFGRCSDPAFFAAGNLLRPVETAGWSWREGRRVGETVAQDLAGALPASTREVVIERDAHIKLVVPQRLAWPQFGAGIGDHVQLRVARAIAGTLSARANGQVIWQRPIDTLPERRILVPLDALPIPADARSILFQIDPRG
ncbi:MAG: FAD-dependent oxidoreductase [Rhodospirillaceae bacterium]|nr:FAD-dependent oxidoreductase [Rhodospirillaceae bacterium]